MGTLHLHRTAGPWEDGWKASKQVETVTEKGGSICERELSWFGGAGRAEK